LRHSCGAGHGTRGCDGCVVCVFLLFFFFSAGMVNELGRQQFSLTDIQAELCEVF
jgi:hypothetical protein